MRRGIFRVFSQIASGSGSFSELRSMRFCGTTIAESSFDARWAALRKKRDESASESQHNEEKDRAEAEVAALGGAEEEGDELSPLGRLTSPWRSIQFRDEHEVHEMPKNTSRQESHVDDDDEDSLFTYDEESIPAVPGGSEVWHRPSVAENSAASQPLARRRFVSAWTAKDPEAGWKGAEEGTQSHRGPKATPRQRHRGTTESAAHGRYAERSPAESGFWSEPQPAPNPKTETSGSVGGTQLLSWAERKKRFFKPNDGATRMSRRFSSSAPRAAPRSNPSLYDPFANLEFKDIHTRLRESAERVDNIPADQLNSYRSLMGRGGVLLGRVNMDTPPIDAEGLKTVRDDVLREMLGLNKRSIDAISSIAEDLESFEAIDRAMGDVYSDRGLPQPSEVAALFVQYVPTYFVECRHVLRALPAALREHTNVKFAKPAAFFARYRTIFEVHEPRFDRTVVRLQKLNPLIRDHQDFGRADASLRQHDVDWKHNAASLDETGAALVLRAEDAPGSESGAVAVESEVTDAVPSTKFGPDNQILQILCAHLPRGRRALENGTAYRFFALVPWINSFPEAHLEVLNRVPQERVLTVMMQHPRIFQLSGHGDHSYFCSVPEGFQGSEAANGSGADNAKAKAAAERFFRRDQEASSAVNEAVRDDLLGLGDVEDAFLKEAQNEGATDLDVGEAHHGGEDMGNGFVFYDPETELVGKGLDSVRIRRRPAELAPRCTTNYSFDNSPAPELLYAICSLMPPPPVAAIETIIGGTRVTALPKHFQKKRGTTPITVSRHGSGPVTPLSPAAFEEAPKMNGGETVEERLARLSPTAADSCRTLLAFWRQIDRPPRAPMPADEQATWHSQFRWTPIARMYAKLDEQSKRQLRDFKGLTNFLRMHGAVFELSTDKMQVIAHDPTRRRDEPPPMLPSAPRVDLGERTMIPEGFDDDEAPPKGALPTPAVGDDQRALYTEVVGGDLKATPLPRTRSQMMRFDGNNPLIDASAQAEEIANLLPDHPVSVGQLMNNLPPTLRACTSKTFDRMLSRSPLFSCWKARGVMMIQRSDLGEAPEGLRIGDQASVESTVATIKASVRVGGRSVRSLDRTPWPAPVRKCIKVLYGGSIASLVRAHPMVFFIQEGSSDAETMVHLVEHLKRFQQ